MTVNPLGRRRQLGTAILDLRTQQGLSHRDLAKKAGISGSTISRLEACTGEPHRRPELADLGLLDALGVKRGSREWDRLQRWAEEAAVDGWWDDKTTATRMGAGQRAYALVEHGAAEILDYGSLLVPGLAQHPDYARERIRAALPPGDDRRVDWILDARLRRQQTIDTAEYRLLLEAAAVYRAGVDQLRHLLDLTERPNISIRVIPTDARLVGHAPRAPFSHISYCHNEPEIVVVDDVAKALLVADPAEISRYADLWTRLESAAMTEDATRRLIGEVADG
ncbi:MAG TPA: helix-turn-helix transcriptional regulator [Micromonospora sp.]